MLDRYYYKSLHQYAAINPFLDNKKDQGRSLKLVKDKAERSQITVVDITVDLAIHEVRSERDFEGDYAGPFRCNGPI